MTTTKIELTHIGIDYTCYTINGKDYEISNPIAKLINRLITTIIQTIFKNAK